MAKKKKSPAHQANRAPGASPVNGVVPPPEWRFKPGESGNPEGRPAVGAAMREWWNVMQDWTQAEIAKVAGDPEAAVNKRAAALEWVKVLAVDGDAIDRIMDRTEGKAKQAVAHTVEDKRGGMDDAKAVGLFLRYKVDHAEWPPEILALYQAGKITPLMPEKD